MADKLKKVADETREPNQVYGVEADVLVLAALEDAVNADNQADVRASVVLELANGPLDTAALDALEARGVHVIPDVVANAGGVVVSYLEWKQNMDGEHWAEERVNDELERIMSSAMKAMTARAAADNVSLKQAAFMIALERLTEGDE